MVCKIWLSLCLVAQTASASLSSHEAEPVTIAAAALESDDECTSEETCAMNALQLRGKLAVHDAEGKEGATCGALNAPENADCKAAVYWAMKKGKWDPHAQEWYGDSIKQIAGVDDFRHQAREGDWQKLFFCAPPGGHKCGLPPCSCTHPPCDQCSKSTHIETHSRPGCDTDPDGIACKPPAQALDYKGMAWPAMNLTTKTGDFHIFAIGDWGGMDGTLTPVEGRPRMVAYRGGHKPGPSVFPRTRWNKQHTIELCSHDEFVACYNSGGAPPCSPGCGYIAGIDDKPQYLVSNALKARAATADPQFILNVGDNFYWGGIDKKCGTPMNQISYTAKHQFDQVFEGMYNGPGLDGKPWLSVLGNHDWGGRVFNNGWDQQIAYTWASNRWVMPAPYFSQHVEGPGFTMDIFMVDSNTEDAKDPPLDSEHNICGSAHNHPDADCSGAGGPSSITTCKAWFESLWSEQEQWLRKKLSESTADWQIIVTHFPCGHKKGFYEELHNQYGLDLLVTGHRHDQELWAPNRLGGLTCFVTGGGGGISSEATPGMDHHDWYGEAQYGFYDLTVSKEKILIESINWDGKLLKSATVYPKK